MALMTCFYTINFTFYFDYVYVTITIRLRYLLLKLERIFKILIARFDHWIENWILYRHSEFS